MQTARMTGGDTDGRDREHIVALGRRIVDAMIRRLQGAANESLGLRRFKHASVKWRMFLRDAAGKLGGFLAASNGDRVEARGTRGWLLSIGVKSGLIAAVQIAGQLQGGE